MSGGTAVSQSWGKDHCSVHRLHRGQPTKVGATETHGVRNVSTTLPTIVEGLCPFERLASGHGVFTAHSCAFVTSLILRS